MAEREQRLKGLRASITQLETELSQLEKEVAENKAELRYVPGVGWTYLNHMAVEYDANATWFRDDPKTTIQRHVRLLHEYNEIKDAAQGLMGLIADAKGVRVAEIHQEYGVDEKD
ncbi:hypothetical protein N7486_007589 [Penicillium sp. IBT 16267x]|nr:hypothetical protein N7486_007589 [Penicillium sp. IBT 16267x]